MLLSDRARLLRDSDRKSMFVSHQIRHRKYTAQIRHFGCMARPISCRSYLSTLGRCIRGVRQLDRQTVNLRTFILYILYILYMCNNIDYLSVQGVHLDDSTSASARCECSDTDPVCPRCGGARLSRDHTVGVARSPVGVTTAADPPTSPQGGRAVVPPSAGAGPVENADEEDDVDEIAGLQRRLHSTTQITTSSHFYSRRQEQRSFSTVTSTSETFSALSDTPTADVGGVSARSAPDTAFPLRQPEVVHSSPGQGQGQGGQRSKLQRLFEPLKRSRSAGNHKETVASLYNPTRQTLTVCSCSSCSSQLSLPSLQGIDVTDLC